MQALRKWDLSESLLPPETIVQFKLPTLWDQYRWQIMLVAAAVIVQSLLIAGLLYQRQRRHTAEAAVAWLSLRW
jgi:hypothetical protein